MKIHDALVELGFKPKEGFNRDMMFYKKANIEIYVLSKEDGQYFTIWAKIRKTTHDIEFSQHTLLDLYTPSTIELLTKFIKDNTKMKLQKVVKKIS